MKRPKEKHYIQKVEDPFLVMARREHEMKMKILKLKEWKLTRHSNWSLMSPQKMMNMKTTFPRKTLQNNGSKMFLV